MSLDSMIEFLFHNNNNRKKNRMFVSYLLQVGIVF